MEPQELAVAVVAEVLVVVQELAAQVVQASSSFQFQRHNHQSQHIFTQHQGNGQHRQELLRLIMFLLEVAVLAAVTWEQPQKLVRVVEVEVVIYQAQVIQ
jgi:hypothetical protein